MEKYIPKIGNRIVARRKVRSKIYHNLIVGPVIEVWSNACRVLTNKGEPSEGDFKLHFSDWDFESINHIT